MRIITSKEGNVREHPFRVALVDDNGLEVHYVVERTDEKATEIADNWSEALGGAPIVLGGEG